MRVQRKFARVGTGLVALSAVLCLAAQAPAAHAQRGGGGGGFGRGGGFGMRAGQQPIAYNAANLPLEVLVKKLSLTDEQKARITDILNGINDQRQKMRDDIRSAMPQRNQNADPNAPRQRPDPTQMQAMFQKMQEAQTAIQENERAKAKEIEALLTPQQKAKLKLVIGDAETFDGVYFPIPLLAELDLSADERTKLVSIFHEARRENLKLQNQMQAQQQQMQQAMQQARANAANGGTFDWQTMRTQMQTMMAPMMKLREDTYQKALAALTPENRAKAEAYMKAHPQRGFGGPGGGGFGGPGGGGFGGPGGGGFGGPGGGGGGGRRGGRGGVPPTPPTGA